jgi:pentapeptide MXKDX repeat protein
MLTGLLPAWLALRFVDRRRFITFEDGALLALIVLPPIQTVYGLMVLDFSPVNPFCSGALAGFVAVYQPSLSDIKAEALEADLMGDDEMGDDEMGDDEIGHDEMGDDEMGDDASTAESVERT